MSIEFNWELVQTGLQIFGYIGVTAILLSIITTWLRNKHEFQRIRSMMILELEDNIFAAENCLAGVSTHRAPTQRLIDDAWRSALFSAQMNKLGSTRVDDPLHQLSLIYYRIRYINDALMHRQNLSLSILRSSPSYNDLIQRMDNHLTEHLEELIPAMKRAKDNLSQKDFKSAFMKNMIYSEITKVQQFRETKKS